MNGVHDMGGMHGLGPVDPEPNEPVFHHEWERRVFALNLAAGFLGKWNLDMSRYSREIMPGPEYLTTTYYEHWLWGLEHLLVEKGLLTAEEIEAKLRGTTASRIAKPGGVRVLPAADVAAALTRPGGHRVNKDVPPRFKAGDRVHTRNINPTGHTRLPRYARDKSGVIDRDHGVHVFPDAHAAGRGKKPQHVYSVRFTMQEVWGPDASLRDSVYIDLWDDYLEPA